MNKNSIIERLSKNLKKFPKNTYLVLIISAVFFVLVILASVFVIVFRKSLFQVEELDKYVDGKIDMVLEASAVSAGSRELDVALSIYPEIANPVSVGVIIFKYDNEKLKLSGGSFRDLANEGLPNTNQFILHNVENFTGGTFVAPKGGEICATPGYVCFTLAYVKDTKFSVEDDTKKGVLADLLFVPVEDGTFEKLQEDTLKFSFVQDKTSLGKLEGEYENVNFNDLEVQVK